MCLNVATCLPSLRSEWPTKNRSGFLGVGEFTIADFKLWGTCLANISFTFVCAVFASYRKSMMFVCVGSKVGFAVCLTRQSVKLALQGQNNLRNVHLVFCICLKEYVSEALTYPCKIRVAKNQTAVKGGGKLR